MYKRYINSIIIIIIITIIIIIIIIIRALCPTKIVSVMSIPFAL